MEFIHERDPSHKKKLSCSHEEDCSNYKPRARNNYFKALEHMSEGFVYVPRPWVAKAVERKQSTSKFEKGVKGIRQNELMYYNSDSNMKHNISKIHGVAILSSRFFGNRCTELADGVASSLSQRRANRVTRHTENTGIHSKYVRHHDVTRQLLRQAIEGRDFALLKVIKRMSPFVKDYLQDKDIAGNNVLHRSCMERNFRLVTVLVEIGLDVNITGERKRTALHLASLVNDTNIVSLLLNSCADVFAKDEEGSRPVDLCSDTKVRTLLLRRMSSRSRSFYTKKVRPICLNGEVDLLLSRTDSGIVMDSWSADEGHRIVNKRREPFRNELQSSFRDFRLSKETVV